jgi:hypothetical protein
MIGAYRAMAGGDPAAGQTYLIYGSGSTPTTPYQAYTHAGDAPDRPIGLIGDGSNSIPASRCTLNYFDGHGPGAGTDAPSLERVTLIRSNSGITNLGGGTLDDVANVVWRVQTTRGAYIGGRATFHYTDAEIAGLDEWSLNLVRAPSLSGPWEIVLSQSVETAYNRIWGSSLTEFGYFALVGPSAVPSRAESQWDAY